MLGQHVSTHLSCRTLLHSELLLIMHPVPNEMITSDDLLRLRVVNKVVEEIDSRLAVHEDSNGSRDNSFSLHLHLEASNPAHSLPSVLRTHVLALTARQRCIAGQLALPGNYTPIRDKRKTSPRSTSIKTCEVACICEPPNVSVCPLAIPDSTTGCAF